MRNLVGRDEPQHHILEEPPVPDAPQPVAPDALREGPFDPGSSLIALLAFLAAIPRLGRSQRLVLVLGHPHVLYNPMTVFAPLRGFTKISRLAPR
jgi:hypothetical protein